MKTKLMAMALMAGSTMFGGVHFGIGVGFGGPVPTASVVVNRPPCPGPGYVWIDGYTDGYGNFVDGYWDLAPYQGAYWVGPTYFGGRFVAGYWGGARGPVYRGYEGYRAPAVVRHEEFRAPERHDNYRAPVARQEVRHEAARPEARGFRR